VARAFPALLLCAFTLAAWQDPKLKERSSPPPSEPREEDESVTTDRQYAFNPIQAEAEMKVGDFYRKRGSFKAAAARYTEASLWNPASPDIWLRLGEVREKLKDPKAARTAYERFLELAPDAKNAPEIRNRLKKLPAPPPRP
jgi:tetratricopeptide (TPR) repeat protein